MGTVVQLEPDDERRAPGVRTVSQPEAGPPTPEAKPGFLSNAPDETWLSSAGKGLATAVGKAASGVVGLPGDLGKMLTYGITGARSFLEDRPHQALLEESEKRGAEMRAAGFPAPAPTSEEVYRAGADYLGAGEYKPTSTLGKYGMLGTEGAASMLMPLGVLGKGLKAGKEAFAVGRPAASAVGAGLRAVAPGMLAGAGLTAGAQGLADVTETPSAALAAIPVAIGTPMAARALYNAAASPVRGARNRLLDIANDPDIARRVIAGGEDVAEHGARRTTPEAYFNPGWANKQVELTQTKNASDTARMRMLQIQEQQRIANKEAIDNLATKNADPMAATHSAEATQRQLQQNVDQLNAALQTATDPTAAAELKRQLVAAHRKQTDAEISRLYRSVDPEGLAQTELKNAREAAANIRKNIDLDVSEMPEELEKLLKRVESEKLNGVQPYQKALQLDQTIEAARRRAKLAGEDNLARQIGELKSGIMADLENVHLPPTEAAAGLDPSAALRAGKDLYIKSLDTFENPYMGAAFRKGKTGYATTPESVANLIFPAGDKGKNGVTAWLAAANNSPEAAKQVQDIALARLHEMRMKGNETLPLTQDMLDKWINKYRGALSALPPEFSTQFTDVVNANTQLGNFAKSQAAKFLNMEDPAAVAAQITKIAGSPNGARDVRALLNSIPESERATVHEGLKRAAAEGLVNRFVGAKSGDLHGAAFSNYVREHEAALKALYGDAYKNLRSIADELKNQEAVYKVGATRGSPTGLNMRTELGPAEQHPVDLVQTAISTALAQQAIGHPAGTLVAMREVGRGAIDWLMKSRAKTINDIITDAIFSPEQMRDLLTGKYKLPPAPASAFGPRAGLRGMQQATQAEEAKQEERRARGYATGGRIGKLNHAAMAAGLIRAAEKAKKGHSTTTEPLLEQPDEAITKALAIADEALS